MFLAKIDRPEEFSFKITFQHLKLIALENNNAPIAHFGHQFHSTEHFDKIIQCDLRELRPELHNSFH